MATKVTSGDLISDRYASALYDLSSDKKLIESVLNDLIELKKLLEDNKNLHHVIKSPLIKSEDNPIASKICAPQ